MELAFIVWAIGVIDKAGTALDTLGYLTMLITMIITIVMVIISQCDESTFGVINKRWLKLAFIGSSALIIGGLFTPSKETLWLMVGGYTAQTVYQSETGVLLKQVIDKKLKEIINESAAKK